MEDNRNILAEEAEDERLHNQFTAYFLTALRRRKGKYLMKYYEHQRMVTSLDKLLDRQEEMPGGPLDKNLAVYEDEVERILRDGALEEVICSDQLLIAVLKLSDRERKILNLHLVHKMKHAEIAAILGLRTNTVEQCYARTIKKLRRYMEEEGEDERL